MLPPWAYAAATVLLFTLPLVFVVVLRATATRPPAQPAQPAGELLCQAVGGPCDGRTWFLPELCPIWLTEGDHRHLYVPSDAAGTIGPVFRYGGVSQPRDVTRPGGSAPLKG